MRGLRRNATIKIKLQSPHNHATSKNLGKERTLATVQAEKAQSSTILLRNTTIDHLKELSYDMSVKDKQKIETYDELVIDMIRVYRKKKGLGDLWD